MLCQTVNHVQFIFSMTAAVLYHRTGENVIMLFGEGKFQTTIEFLCALEIIWCLNVEIIKELTCGIEDLNKRPRVNSSWVHSDTNVSANVLCCRIYCTIPSHAECRKWLLRSPIYNVALVYRNWNCTERRSIRGHNTRIVKWIGVHKIYTNSHVPNVPGVRVNKENT